MSVAPSAHDRKTRRWVIAAMSLLLTFGAVERVGAQNASVSGTETPTVSLPEIVLRGIPFEISVSGAGGDSVLVVYLDEQPRTVAIENAAAKVSLTHTGSGPAIVRVVSGDRLIAQQSVPSLPAWLSVLPALLAIVAALVFRQVVVALFAGIWLGAWMGNGLTWSGLWLGLLETLHVYVLNTLVDADHMSIIIFSLMIGGMVGIISRNGGTMGIVDRIVHWARSARRGQLATALLGVFIFFDDYANTLIVGNTMRPITDRLRISREKLAYLVDSTAAPVATLALVTTWIGFQVGLIDESVRQIEGFDESAYAVFLNSIPYTFYTLLALGFVFAVAISRRDFGPMLAAETRARSTGALWRKGATIGSAATEQEEMQPPPGKPRRALNAVIPVVVLVAGTLIGIYVTGVQGAGSAASLRDVIGAGNAFKAMMWASLIAVLTAGALSTVQRILTVGEIVDAWYAGMKAMFLAIIILTLAWALSEVNVHLHTAEFLISTLGEAVAPAFLPTIVFVLSAATAFATGSSWGVMGIVMPLVVPVSWAVMVANGIQDDPRGLQVLYASVASVLAGAVWGDHCSPISDTTILSSMASQCDHIDHVRTQLPYALIVAASAVVFGLIPVGFGLPWYVALPIAMTVLLGILRVFGQQNEPAV